MNCGNLWSTGELILQKFQNLSRLMYGLSGFAETEPDLARDVIHRLKNVRLVYVYQSRNTARNLLVTIARNYRLGRFAKQLPLRGKPPATLEGLQV